MTSITTSSDYSMWKTAVLKKIDDFSLNKQFGMAWLTADIMKVQDHIMIPESIKSPYETDMVQFIAFVRTCPESDSIAINFIFKEAYDRVLLSF